MPIADVNAGLVLPNAAVAMLGQGGAACTLLLIFMAVTSASSAELIAVSSIFTYDLYQVCAPLFFPPSILIMTMMLMNCAVDIFQPNGNWQEAYLYVPHYGRPFRRHHGGFQHRALLCRCLDGLPIPPHGSNSLQCGPTSIPNSSLEGSE